MTTTTAGPKGLPVTGNLFAFRKDPLGFLQNAREKYGDLVHIRFGPNRHAYLLSNPEHIKEVLVSKQEHFRKAKGLRTAKAVVGEGILTSEGDMHKRQRRFMQPCFRKDRIARYADTMVKHAERMVQSWHDGEERSISKDMMELTLGIITETMFGANVSSDAGDIGDAIERGMKFVSRKASSFIDIPLSVPTRSNMDFKEANELLDKTIFSIIRERRQSMQHMQDHAESTGGRGHGESSGGRDDLLSMLLAARDEEDGEGMTDRQVRDEVMTIFLAGHETTANTLQWTLYLLSQNPEVERKWLAELDEVLQGRSPGVDDLAKLGYTTRIVSEAMRLFPAAWVINREATEDVEIGGHVFKKGETIMMSQYVMHRSSEYFDDPEQFRPERFEGDLLKTIPQFAYFPFGGGPRICIGNHFALTESALVLAVIGAKYRLRLAEGQPPVEAEPLVTLRPKHELRMVAVKRTPSAD